MPDVSGRVDRSKIKIGIFAAVTAVVAFAFGYALNGLLGGTIALPVVAVLAGVFVLFGILQAACVKGQLVYAGVLGIETIAFFAPLVGHFSQGVLLAGVACYVLLLSGGRRTQAAAANDLKVSITRMSRAGIPAMATGIALFIAALYVSPLVGVEWKVTEKTVASITGPTEFALRRVVPDFSLAMSVGEVIDVVGNSGLVAGLGELPAEARAALLQQSRGAILAQVSEAVGVPVTAGTSVRRVLTVLLSDWAGRVPEEWHTLIIVLYGILLFSAIKGFGFLLGYPVQLAAWGLYQLLIAAGFFHVASESASKESIVL